MKESPWCKSGIFAAVLGFAIPAATAVQGWFQKERELELQEKQQMQELRLAYMSTLVSAGLEGMVLIADFAAATEQDERIREWARIQRDEAEEAAKRQRQQLEELEAKVVEAEQERQAATEKANRAAARTDELSRQSGADRTARKRAEEATGLETRRCVTFPFHPVTRVGRSYLQPSVRTQVVQVRCHAGRFFERQHES